MPNLNDLIKANSDEFKSLKSFDREAVEEYVHLLSDEVPKKGESLLLLSIKDAQTIFDLLSVLEYKNIIIVDNDTVIKKLKAYIKIHGDDNKNLIYYVANEVNINLSMKFDLIIANPPYGKVGNPLISEAITHLADNSIASVLMPLSCYKKNGLYRHVETFELANPKLFKDAVVQKDLCVSILYKKAKESYIDYNTFILPMLAPEYLEYFNYNLQTGKKYKCNRFDSCDKNLDKKKLALQNRDIWFMDGSRFSKQGKGIGYHAKNNTFGYQYNILKLEEPDWVEHALKIDFVTKTAKDNFCKYAYNYIKNPLESLCTKVITSLRRDEMSGNYWYYIPQIDWSNIHINQKELWDKGLYDEAALSEMHLKWNDDKTKIVQA